MTNSPTVPDASAMDTASPETRQPAKKIVHLLHVQRRPLPQQPLPAPVSSPDSDVELLPRDTPRLGVFIPSARSLELKQQNENAEPA